MADPYQKYLEACARKHHTRTNRSWEEYATPGIYALIKMLDQDPSDDSQKIAASLKFTSSLRPERTHVKAAPIFELSSVCIRKNILKKIDDIDCTRVEIYGYIQLIYENGKKYLVFNADNTDPEIVYLWNDISVILRESTFDRPPWLPKRFWLELCLKDRLRDIEIVNDKKYFDFSSIDGSVEHSQKSLLFNTKECDIVHVRYRVLQYAVLAYVEFTVVKNEENNDISGSEDVAVVTGTIVATCKVADEVFVPTRVLFDKNCYDPANLVPTKLSWIYWLGVPAYSGLVIEANLKVNGEEIGSGHALFFEAEDECFLLEYKEIVGQKWRIRVSVTWCNGYDLPPEDGVWGFDFKPDAEESEECLDSSLPNQQPLSDVSNQRVLPSRSCFGAYPLPLVEVFSISVHSFCSDYFLYGTINSYDSFEEYYDVFGCDEEKFIYVDGPERILPLENPRHCYEGEWFGIHFDLKDVGGLEISYGHVSYCPRSVIGWHDKRICSVVPGRDGFAVVHYTMFSDAVQAKVKVFFTSDNGRAHLFCGVIRARYSGYRYSTSYEKKYYQSMLFEKDFLELSDGDEVPLLKSAVAVPSDASLIVKACFSVRDARDAGKDVELRGEATFKFKPEQPPQEPQTIKGPNYGLSVSVEWG